MESPKRRGILCVVGTRPEVIKMAPVIKALQESPWAECRVLVTAQHRELLDQMLAFFGIVPHVDLDAMRPNQSLPELTARLLLGLNDALARETPDLVLAQGDTTTVLATALASFYRRIPFGHVEAGLRTHCLNSPFPEEANRVLAGHLASLHFAPTPEARNHLLREGIPPEAIHLTGNTVIDALLWTVQQDVPLDVPLDPNKRMILVTAHRRDSFGEPIRNICQAVAALCRKYADVEFLWPVHPNPAVQPVVESLLGACPQVRLCPPLGYGSFATAMRRAHLILTDSGGVQEESPALGKPVLVMREHSERPEAIHAGVAKLVGSETQTIVDETSKLLDDPVSRRLMSLGASPYGDGKAARRIVAAIRRFLNVSAACSEDDLREFAPRSAA